MHGGIEGYSRTIVYLHCSTLLSCLHSLMWLANMVYPIRLDQIGVVKMYRCGWQYMIEQHNSESAGLFNTYEKIERLWRDVYRCVGVLSE